jgi:NADH-quinone oxidoreductase subunit L
MDYIWLIPLLPGLGALVNGVFGIRAFSKNVAAAIACGTMGAAALVSIIAFAGLLGLSPESRVHEVTVASWITAIPLQTTAGIGTFEVPWALRLDPLSGMMILVVTGIGFLIHVYSVAYMHDEPRGAYARFFCYLNLFCFFMLTLVLGSNFLVMFVGWEGVGLCSYLLIGFWYEKHSASSAGMKAFVVNRIGDWGFVLGIFLVFFTFGTLDFRAVAEAAAARPVETAGFGVLSVIAILLFVGATGKSAQIPLYVWLPDAMEGPTPVSALIHAATMVTAGVYMVCRNAVLFSHAPLVMEIVAVIGALTALMAASIGLVQYDIKRVLAYSTVSQLGYMFLATGVGAFAAGAFHLTTHAFFKALLFLGSGSVIHAMAGEQDMRRMGALKAYMPVTFGTMLIGTLAIAGIPPLSGFFSKDEILYRTFLENRLLWILAAVTAGMTAFYMFRLMSMTFLSAYRGPAWTGAHGHAPGHHDAAHGHDDPDAHGHPDAPGGHGHGAWHGPHESPRFMTVPLMVLAMGAVVAGFVGIPAALGGGNAIEHFLEPSFTAHGAATADPAASTSPAGAEPAAEPAGAATAAQAAHAPEESHGSTGVEIGLMAFSVLVALAGIGLAYRMYVLRPEASERMAERFAGIHRILSHKYYVDELYDATVVRGSLGTARGLWRFDGGVVDGAVNGSGWFTLASSWVSHMIDKYVVDGLVNFVGRVAAEASFTFRRFQTGLIQNYALLMLFGVFVFVSLYLFRR